MKRNKWLGSLVLLALLCGCVVPNSTLPPTTPTSTFIPQTATYTSVPTFVLTSIPPTLNPLPTLSAEEAKSLVFTLLEDNGDCQLPCLWGLTPGNTDSQALGKFVAQFDNLTTPDIYVSTHDFEDRGNFFVSYRKDNIHIDSRFGYLKNKDDKNKIEMLVLNGYAMQERGKDLDWLSLDISPLYGDASFNEAFKYYLLPQMLSNYGSPSQVLMAPFPDDPDRPDIEWHPFSLVLLYPEKGIFIEYVSPRETVGNNYVGCPSKVTVSLAVWDPESNLSLTDVVQKAGSEINELNIDYFKSIDQATTMTLEEFFQTFKIPENTTCLETPAELWPGP